MPRRSRGALYDSGPVAFHSGDLDALRDRLPHAFEALAAAGATIVSWDPPMWVLDGCEEVAAFVRFAEAEAAGAPELAWARLENPGAYGLQERLGIPKADAGGVRDELKPLDSLLRRLTGPQTGLLEAATGWGETAPVKRYRQGPGDELLELARLGDDRVLALERVHVDRRRDAGDEEGYRDPMRLTLVVSYDEAGGTYFPYALPARECPGVELLPTVLDRRSLRAGTGEEATTWPADEGAHGRGVLVRGRRGRLLVFASSSADPKVPLYSSLHQGVLIRRAGAEDAPDTVPLYSSLHQGVLIRRAGAEDAPDTAPPRMVSVIGACGGGRYETSSFHECLEHESIETRACFWGRTVEEEATGMYMAQGSNRSAEAWAFLERRAELRRTTVDVLIAQELARSPELAGWINGPRTPAVLPEEEEDADASMPRIFWRESCTVCMGVLCHPESAAEEDAEHLVPGYLSCGHTLCRDCHDAIAERVFRGGRAICPECRQISRHKWRPLLVDGQWAMDVAPEGIAAKPRCSKSRSTSSASVGSPLHVPVARSSSTCSGRTCTVS